MAIDLLYPEPTRLDINFRFLGIPVRVSPGFWVLHGLIGLYFAASFGVFYFFLWPGGVFISILVHEFGHVIAGRWFGARGEIVLTVFGGLAIGSSDLFHRWQRVVVYLAGPVAQLLLGIGLWIASAWLQEWWLEESISRIAESSGPPDPGDIDRLTQAIFPPWLLLVWINIAWPLCNLLPVLPLDGGQIAREFVRHRKILPWEQDPNLWKWRS